VERPSGLGRSLEDVLDSLSPADPDPAAPGRVLFEPEDLEQQLDSLMGEIRELRDRVQHLVALVPGDDTDSSATASLNATAGTKVTKDKGKAGGKKAGKHGGKAKKGAKRSKVGGKAKSAKAGAKPRPQREAA
jgi:hypothetical protein